MVELCRVGTLVTTGSGFGGYVKSMVLDLLWDYCLVCLWDINGLRIASLIKLIKDLVVS